MAFALNNSDVRKLKRILEEFLERSEADACLVCDQAGHVLAKEGLAAQDPLLISALGAGVFAASRELAGLLGEDEFSAVLHQGTQRSIMICAVNEEALMVVIFSLNASVGLVKLYAPTAATSVRAILDGAWERGPVSGDPDHIFVLSDKGSIFEEA